MKKYLNIRLAFDSLVLGLCMTVAVYEGIFSAWTWMGVYIGLSAAWSLLLWNDVRRIKAHARMIRLIKEHRENPKSFPVIIP